MLPAGFEPAFPASELPQTHVSKTAAAGIGLQFKIIFENPTVSLNALCNS
jgi:hypothetical protein